MYIAITIIIILISILLGLAVLIQNSKGGGLAGSFAGSSQVMGVRKTTDFIEKFTWGMATALVVLCIAANFVIPSGNSTGQVQASSIQEQIDNATLPTAPAAPLPSGGQQQPAQQQQPAGTPAK